MVTSSFSPSRETLAPGFSATNLAGSIVLLLTICGAESFVFEVPKTSASFSPRFIVGLTDAGRKFIMTLLIEVKTAEWQIFNWRVCGRSLIENINNALKRKHAYRFLVICVFSFTFVWHKPFYRQTSISGAFCILTYLCAKGRREWIYFDISAAQGVLPFAHL